MIKTFAIGNVVSWHNSAWIVSEKRFELYTIISLSGKKIKKRVSDTTDPQPYFLADTALDYAKQSLENNF